MGQKLLEKWNSRTSFQWEWKYNFHQIWRFIFLWWVGPLQQRARSLGESFICACDLKIVDNWCRLLGMSFCCNLTWKCHMSSWCSSKQSCSGSCYTCTLTDCVQLRPLLLLWGFLGRVCGISTASLSSVLVWDMFYVVLKDVHKTTAFPEKEVHYIGVVMLCTTWR